MISVKSYSDRMKTILSQSGVVFYQIRQDHIQYFKGDCNAAAVLGFLINQIRMRNSNTKERKQLRRNDMWFKCPAKLIQNKFNMGEDRQRGSIKKLVTLDVIEAEVRGVPATLWVRINTDKLIEIEQEYLEKETQIEDDANHSFTRNGVFPELENTVPGKPRNYTRENPVHSSGKTPDLYNTNKHTNNPTNNVSPQHTNSRLTNGKHLNGHAKPNKAAPFFEQNQNNKSTNTIKEVNSRLAELFYEGLSKANKIMRKPILASWSNQIGELIRMVMLRDNCSLSQAQSHVEMILRDHLTHIKECYQPKYYSIKPLIELDRDHGVVGFIRLEDAKERREQDEAKQDKKKRVYQDDSVIN